MYQRFSILSSLALAAAASRVQPLEIRLPAQLQDELITLPMIMSANRKKIDVSVTMISTMAVVIQTSFQVGHVTFDISWRTSSMNVKRVSSPSAHDPCEPPELERLSPLACLV